MLFDASALIAYLLREPGFEKVEEWSGVRVMSAVNVAETVLKMGRVTGLPLDKIEEKIVQLGFEIIPFGLPEVSYLAGHPFKGGGLSLGDRICLATACRLSLPVMTADRVWAELALPVKVVLIRQ